MTSLMLVFKDWEAQRSPVQFSSACPSIEECAMLRVTRLLCSFSVALDPGQSTKGFYPKKPHTAKLDNLKTENAHLSVASGTASASAGRYVLVTSSTETANSAVASAVDRVYASLLVQVHHCN